MIDYTPHIIHYICSTNIRKYTNNYTFYMKGNWVQGSIHMRLKNNIDHLWDSHISFQ